MDQSRHRQADIVVENGSKQIHRQADIVVEDGSKQTQTG